MQQRQEMRVRLLSRKDPLEEEMATQYPCLENPMDREAWRATVCGVAKESDMTEHACTATVTAVTLTSNSLPAICCENFPFIISSFHLHKPSMGSVL